MKAGEVCINDIFNGARLIEVPFYQRAYVWKEEQWERFLTDMEYVSDTQRHYFLGSIILKNGETPNMTDAFSSRKIIIDGQQRLTTLILFFKVLCLKVGCNGYFDHDFRFSNGDIAMQHGRNDSAAFKLVTSQNTAGEIKNTTPPSSIIAAYNFFMQKADPARINLNVIKQNVQFVSVDLVDSEDEQQVFDTINSLGVRLTTAELLKNYFYSRDNVREYEENWVSVFEKDAECKQYWDQEIETGRIKRSLIDIFFDAYFQLLIQNRDYAVSVSDKIAYARVDHLAKSYQDFIDKYCAKDKNVVLKHMADYAACFAETFRPDSCERSIPSAYGMERINLQSKGVLYMMESAIQPVNAAMVLLGFKGYSLEHLMPKKWRNNWAPCKTEELAKKRDSCLLTLGNLAIIPQPLNASIRDANWTVKKAGKGTANPGLELCASGLLTIHDVLKEAAWTEEKIDARADWLFEQAKRIWKT